MNKITKKDLETKLQELNIIEEELENTILNYEDYKNGYVDSIYQFIIDNGIFYVACSDEVEGLDFIIDHLENEGLACSFAYFRKLSIFTPSLSQSSSKGLVHRSRRRQ